MSDDMTMELPDDFPDDFTLAWHAAGALVADSVLETLADRATEEDVAYHFGDLLAAAAAMAFSMGATWRDQHPNETLKLRSLETIVHTIMLDHFLDEAPG